MTRKRPSRSARSRRRRDVGRFELARISKPRRILSIDIGGSGLKAAVLDPLGKMLTERVRVETPHPCPPAVLVDSLVELVRPLPASDCVSVGFPGVVRRGRVLTAPNLSDELAGFDLGRALARRLGRPVRIINDAEMQGLAAIGRQGVELVVTLGTGVGTGLFEDGRPAPHLELAHHPFRRGETYEEQLGAAAIERVGRKRWNRRLKRAIRTLRGLTNFDRLYLGGGNARKITIVLDSDTRLVSNKLGMTGGAWLWR